MPNHLDELLKHAEIAARRGGETAMKYFRQTAPVARNGKYDVKSMADGLVDKEIAKYLLQNCTEHSLFTEESQLVAGECTLDGIWLIDPIDGTNNFCFRIPYFGVSVTFFDEGQPKVSCIYDPILNDLYLASLGNGARRNGSLCTAHAGRLLEENVSVVANYSESGRAKGDQLRNVLSGRCKRVLELWAPSMDLTRVATGMFGSVVCIDSKLLDVCAGILLLREAGGVVIDFDGKPFSYKSLSPESAVNFVAAANASMAEETLRMCWTVLHTQ